MRLQAAVEVSSTWEAEALWPSQARVSAFLVASVLTRSPPEHPEDDHDRDRGYDNEDDSDSDHL
jgi:hypothetical protein